MLWLGMFVIKYLCNQRKYYLTGHDFKSMFYNDAIALKDVSSRRDLKTAVDSHTTIGFAILVSQLSLSLFALLHY